MSDIHGNEPLQDTQKSILDPAYDLVEFNKDFSSRQVRWLSTILAAVSLGLLLYWRLSGDEPAVYYPITLKGPAAFWLTASAALVWLVIAVKNWAWWLQHRHSTADSGAKAGK